MDQIPPKKSHGSHHGGEGDQGDHCRGDGVDPLRGVGGLDLRGAHAQLADGPVEARGVASVAFCSPKSEKKWLNTENLLLKFNF